MPRTSNERERTYSGLEPIDEFDDVGVLKPLKHLKFVVHHLLVSLDILLQDDLDGDLAGRAFGLANDAIGSST